MMTILPGIGMDDLVEYISIPDMEFFSPILSWDHDPILVSGINGTKVGKGLEMAQDHRLTGSHLTNDDIDHLGILIEVKIDIPNSETRIDMREIVKVKIKDLHVFTMPPCSLTNLSTSSMATFS